MDIDFHDIDKKKGNIFKKKYIYFELFLKAADMSPTRRILGNNNTDMDQLSVVLFDCLM